ncbi:hypothetical protein F5144DRAFT_142152 [Chaetomium tenue]|uniref:Uncharacterized protein n=1 Tax=Chaetomium tenue TaxID=1854479 RepID=A0ACB7PJ66_9PEZI|nr:hypothetical protein F5144DRAFT_142152 [Chaetomium globosum]
MSKLEDGLGGCCWSFLSARIPKVARNRHPLEAQSGTWCCASRPAAPAHLVLAALPWAAVQAMPNACNPGLCLLEQLTISRDEVDFDGRMTAVAFGYYCQWLQMEGPPSPIWSCGGWPSRPFQGALTWLSVCWLWCSPHAGWLHFSPRDRISSVTCS